MAKDPVTGEVTAKPIRGVFAEQHEVIVELKLRSQKGVEVIPTTPEHPFFIEGQGWVNAGDLEAGDKLVSLQDLAITVVEVEYLEGDFKALNINVDGYHTYAVGESEAWVHNVCDIYSRPSGYRKGVRDDVWEDAREASTGQVRDPVTGQFMSKDKPWDMGHKPGHEFKKHKQSAEQRNITREQFLDEHNNASHYRPELPSSNRSHKGEDTTDLYFGP